MVLVPIVIEASISSSAALGEVNLYINRLLRVAYAFGRSCQIITFALSLFNCFSTKSSSLTPITLSFPRAYGGPALA